nr:hypothetical protein [Tanacetum cinerariifolium]
MIEDMQGTPAATSVAGLSQRMSNFVTTVRQDTNESMHASDTARTEVMSLRTRVLEQQTKIAGLRVADCTRQTQLVEALTLLKTLQTQMAELQRQHGPARGPTYPEVPEEAGSSS